MRWAIVAVALLAGCAAGAGERVAPSSTTTRAPLASSTTSTLATPVLWSCEELQLEGASVDDLVVAEEERGCRHETGVIYYPWTASEPCIDGRVLHYNDVGWGFTPGGEWHLHPRADGHHLPPEDVLERCGLPDV